MADSPGPEKVIITIIAEGGTVAPQAVGPIQVKQNSLVSFVSPQGDVEIHFPTPFGKGPVFHKPTDLEVTGPKGVYLFECGVITKNGERLGWPGPVGNKDGGQFEVVRRG